MASVFAFVRLDGPYNTRSPLIPTPQITHPQERHLWTILILLKNLSPEDTCPFLRPFCLQITFPSHSPESGFTSLSLLYHTNCFLLYRIMLGALQIILWADQVPHGDGIHAPASTKIKLFLCCYKEFAVIVTCYQSCCYFRKINSKWLTNKWTVGI